MSEKRERKQQRRGQRRASRTGSVRGSGPARQAGDADVEAALAEVLAGLADVAAARAHEPRDGLEAELWASGLVGTFRQGPLQDPSAVEAIEVGLVAALEKHRSAGAVATLRALGALEGHCCAPRARAAARRLASAGIPEPSWAGDLGHAQPVTAMLMTEPVFDDGVSVMIEFARPDREPHTLGVYIDHNMGGLVKDVFVAGPLAGLRDDLARNGAGEDGVTLRELDLGEARARVERALDIFEHTLDPPVDDDVGALRALVHARMTLLPAGATLSDACVEVAPEKRDRLLSDFLESSEGRRWCDDEEAEDVVALAIAFGADYNHGGPLRWSPVVVEIFMTDWLARKAPMERAFFERVPEVLADWVSYAGRCRGVPEAAWREAAAAVEDFREEMFASIDDPEAWGPAKMFALAAQEAGVDLSDPAAVEAFVERYNRGLAA